MLERFDQDKLSRAVCLRSCYISQSGVMRKVAEMNNSFILLSTYHLITRHWNNHRISSSDYNTHTHTHTHTHTRTHTHIVTPISGQIVKSEQGERFLLPSLFPPLSFFLTPSFPSLSPSLPVPSLHLEIGPLKSS